LVPQKFESLSSKKFHGVPNFGSKASIGAAISLNQKVIAEARDAANMKKHLGSPKVLLSRNRHSSHQ